MPETQYTDLRVAISFLEGCRDRSPVLYDLRWQAVLNMLTLPEERAEKDGRAFVPAEFGEREYERRDGTNYKAVLRKKEAVEHVSMAVLDYDDGVAPKQAWQHFRSNEHAIYSTHSHRRGKPKFRVVLPLAEPVAAGHWESAWLHLRDAARINGHDIDLACSDASRLYYMPSHPPGTKPGFRYNAGELLTLPAWEHPDIQARQGSEWLSAIVANLDTGGPEITLPEWLSDKGVTYRPKRGAADIYQLERCPWSSEHSSGTDGWGHAAVLVKDGKWAFSCCHATCKERGRGWPDFRILVAGPKKEYSPREDFKVGFGRPHLADSEPGLGPLSGDQHELEGVGPAGGDRE